MKVFSIINCWEWEWTEPTLPYSTSKTPFYVFKVSTESEVSWDFRRMVSGNISQTITWANTVSWVSWINSSLREMQTSSLICWNSMVTWKLSARLGLVTMTLGTSHLTLAPSTNSIAFCTKDLARTFSGTNTTIKINSIFHRQKPSNRFAMVQYLGLQKKMQRLRSNSNLKTSKIDSMNTNQLSSMVCQSLLVLSPHMQFLEIRRNSY